MMDVSLPARSLFNLGPFVISDSILGALLVALTMAGFGVLIARKFDIVPTRAQVVLEWMSSYLLEQLESAFGSKQEARSFFALIFTILLFVTIANQFVLIPLIFQITLDGAPILRQPTADLGGTIALSLLVVGLSHILALRISPVNHLKNFFPLHSFVKVRSFGDFFNAGIELFIGLLNIVGEFAKVVSLAARLFGNIFAGNVMAAVIASLIPFIVPLPFLFLSIFSGFIQAFVFMLLSMQFIAMTIQGAKPQIQELKEDVATA
jgi:F-type H+-transporting ATPase subunit a